MSVPDSKTCTKCGKAKPLDAYYFEKGKPRSCCKTCHKAKLYEQRQDRAAYNAKRRAYTAANPDKIREQSAKHWAKYKDEINAHRRDDRRLNPDKYLPVQRASWHRRKDRVNAERRAAWANDPAFKAKLQKWKRENPEKVAAHDAAKRARKYGAERQPYTRLEIYERDGGRCRLCEVELPFEHHAFHLDHIVPLCLGGPDMPANLQLTCPDCNRRKHANLEGQIHMPV